MESVNHLHQTIARWYAVLVPYKKEKYVFRQLQKKGISTYLPIQKLTRRYTRKIKTVELPFINCYIFVKIVKADYVRVLETEYVTDFIRFGKDLIAIPDHEIDLLKRILREKLEVVSEPKFYYEGDRVEIISGNLTGIEGTFLKVEGKTQVLVDLDYLGYTLRIHIDPALIQKKTDARTGS